MVQSTGRRRVLHSLPLLLALGMAAAGCAQEISSSDAEESLSLGGGTLDRTFGKNGALRVNPIAGEKETEVRIDPLGRFVQFAVVRKGDNAWLKVDATNVRGEKLPNYGTSLEPSGVPLDPWPGAVLAVDFLKDGSPLVLVGGLCAASGCPHDYDEPGISRRYLLKLKPSGALDPSFGKGGSVEFDAADPNSTDDVYGYRVSPALDGSSIVVAIDRPDGTQVRTVDMKGRTLAESTFKFPKGEFRGRTGPIVGLTKDSALLVRLQPSITGDTPSTAQIYKTTLSTGKMSASIESPIGVQDARKVVARSVKVVGQSVFVMGHSAPSDHGGTIAGYSLTKYNMDLTLDRTFGTRGTASLKVGKQGWGGEAYDFTVMPDGKIVVVGTVSTSAKSDIVLLDVVSNYDLAVVRFNANGTPDLTFGENATQLVGAGSDHESYRALLPTKNAVYLVGKADSDIVFSMLR